MAEIAVRAVRRDVVLRAPVVITRWIAELWADVVVPCAPESPADIEWTADGDGWIVRLGTSPPERSSTAEALADTMMEINRVAADSAASTRAVVHGAAFVTGGRAVALVGASTSGKSTTVAAAVLRGHEFLAEEVCAIDPGAGVVDAYHRPIGLRHAGAEALGITIPDDPRYSFSFPWRVSAGGRLGEPSPLGLIAFVRRRAGGAELRRLSAVDALVHLSTNSLAAHAREREMFRRFERLARDVPAVEVHFDDAFEAVDLLAAEVGR